MKLTLYCRVLTTLGSFDMGIPRSRSRPMSVAVTVLVVLAACSWLGDAQQSNFEEQNEKETSLSPTLDTQEAKLSDATADQKTTASAAATTTESIGATHTLGDDEGASSNDEKIEIEGAPSIHSRTDDDAVSDKPTDESESLPESNGIAIYSTESSPPVESNPDGASPKHAASATLGDRPDNNPISGTVGEDLKPKVAEADTQGSKHMEHQDSAPNFDRQPLEHVTDSTTEESKSPNATENGSDIKHQDTATDGQSSESNASDPHDKSQKSSVPEIFHENQGAPSQENEEPPLRRHLDSDYLDLDDATHGEPEALDLNEAAQGQPPVAQLGFPHELSEGEMENEGAKEEQSMESAVNLTTSPFQHEDPAASDENLAKNEENGLPRVGSLASFSEKVKNQDHNEPTEVAGTAKNESPLATSPSILSEDLDEAAMSGYYTWTWGMPRSDVRYANLEVLGSLFHRQLADDATNRYSKVFEPVGDLVIPTLYSKMTTSDIENDDPTPTNSDAPIENPTSPRSVNTEFVEGLDDLDKFFEGVDPPDELDVPGSIQDVLMGQTGKIIIKRVTLGLQYVSTTYKAIKSRITEFAAKDDRRLPELKKEQFGKAKGWAVARGKEGFSYAKNLFSAFFNDDDDPDGEEFLNYASDLENKLRDLTGSDTSD